MRGRKNLTEVVCMQGEERTHIAADFRQPRGFTGIMEQVGWGTGVTQQLLKGES